MKFQARPHLRALSRIPNPKHSQNRYYVMVTLKFIRTSFFLTLSQINHLIKPSNSNGNCIDHRGNAVVKSCDCLLKFGGSWRIQIDFAQGLDLATNRYLLHRGYAVEQAGKQHQIVTKNSIIRSLMSKF